MTKLRHLGSKARRDATAFAQLITWPLRRFPLLVAPLYPKLQWLASLVVLALVINLFSTYIAEGFNLPVLKRATEFIAAHQSPILVTMGGVLALFFVARVGHTWSETRRRLRAAFGIYTSAQELGLADMGFRASRPQEPERRETHREERPFFGTYFPRKAVEDRESTDADADMVREFAEEELEQLVRNGRGFLLIGHPYSGKTITLFQILRRMTGYTVVSPDDSRPVADEETFALLKGRKVVILLDDLPTLARSDYNLGLFVRRIAKATTRRYGVVGTCREGGDLTAIAAGHRGQTLSRMELFDDALAAFARAIELHPDNPEAHYHRGRTFALLGRYDSALPAFARAIELRPDHPEAYCDRSQALANLGHHTDEEATRLRPDYPEAHRERGFILGQLGFDEEALAAFNWAIEIRPEYAEALQDVDVALLLRPEFPEAYFTRGFVLTTIKAFSKGRLEQALHA